MQEAKILKQDISRSLLLLLIGLVLFGVLRYFESTQGVLTNMLT